MRVDETIKNNFCFDEPDEYTAGGMTYSSRKRIDINNVASNQELLLELLLDIRGLLSVKK